MITLFHHPKTRSTRFIFLLEELGVDYRIQQVNVRKRDGTGERDPANPHPLGKVPAILDAGTVVFESSAIALYLTDRFPQSRLGPTVGEPQRGAYLSWLAYYSGVLEPAFVSKFLKTEVPRGTAGWVVVEEALTPLVEALGRGPYLLGEHFSAVDVLYGTTFAMFRQSPLMEKSAVIHAYAERTVSRPAYQRALACEGG